MSHCEEAWATLRNAGFVHQYEDGWYCIHPDQVLVGRALTSMWMPGRPDIEKQIETQGKEDHRQGGTNAWPVDMLQPRDVYVSDHFELKQDGPSIGDNVEMQSTLNPEMASFTMAPFATSTASTNCRTSRLSSASTILPIILEFLPPGGC